MSCRDGARPSRTIHELVFKQENAGHASTGCGKSHKWGTSCGSAWAQTFSYDEFGNIVKSGSLSCAATHNSKNQIATLGSTVHAWLTFVIADGTVDTYGTYGNGNGAQGVEGVNENSELSYPATASRSAALSADQAPTLDVYITDMIEQGPAAWSTAWPCSGFAAVGWNLTTGENLDPTRHGILNSPENLEGAINAANN